MFLQSFERGIFCSMIVFQPVYQLTQAKKKTKKKQFWVGEKLANFDR